MTRLTTESIKIDFISKHGNLYNYDSVEYVTNEVKVNILCKACSEFFEQTPKNHKRGQGCPTCAGRNITTESVINEFKATHNDKFDYSKFIYKAAIVKGIIICNTCTYEFEQTPILHKTGSGCPCCANKTKTTEIVIAEFKAIHGSNYDYSAVEYTGSKNHVTIKCNSCSNIFEQRVFHHKDGKGCPKCHSSHGEQQINTFLVNLGLKFICEKKFENLKNKNSLRFDFYLPELNTLIEFDGQQHFEPVRFGGISPERALENYNTTVINDSIKNKYALDNGIKLIRISFIEDLQFILKSHFSSKDTL